MSAAHLRLSRVSIERLDWAACIDRYDRAHTLFYLDPPYWQTEGYGVPFPTEEYTKMAELLRSIQGKAVVSVNDVPAMRDAFAGLPMRRLAIKYSVAQARSRRNESGELLIRNWREQRGGQRSISRRMD